MKKQFVIPKFVVTSLMFSAPSAYAGDHEHESHGAHEHGLAKIMLVTDQQKLTLQFESPAINIVGFEHEAKTSTQHEAIHKAVEGLASSEALFSISGTECTFAEAKVDNPFHSDSEHEDHGHDEHKHEEHHHKESEHAHDDHEEHDEHHTDAEHREFFVEYSATCQAADKIEQIDVKLLKQFSGIEILDVQYIHANKQGAVSLNQKQAILRFD